MLLPLLASLLVWATPAAAQTPFIPDSFQPPQSHKTAQFQLVPLGPDLAKHDYDAYMSSIDHLRANFSSGNWPHAALTMDDARKDVEGEIARFRARKAFTYAVLTPDGSREMGCVYVRPSRKQGYDATVALWVTKAEFDRGFQPQLVREVKAWIASYLRVDISPKDFAALPDK